MQQRAILFTITACPVAKLARSARWLAKPPHRQREVGCHHRGCKTYIFIALVSTVVHLSTAATRYILAAIDRYEWGRLGVSQLAAYGEDDVCHILTNGVRPRQGCTTSPLLIGGPSWKLTLLKGMSYRHPCRSDGSQPFAIGGLRYGRPQLLTEQLVEGYQNVHSSVWSFTLRQYYSQCSTSSKVLPFLTSYDRYVFIISSHFLIILLHNFFFTYKLENCRVGLINLYIRQ